MSAPPNKVTAAKLEAARDQREHWKLLAEAAGYKQEALALDPSLPDRHGRLAAKSETSIADDYVQNYREGLKIRAFKESLGETTGTHISPSLRQVNPTELVQQKAAIIKALATTKSPEEIEAYLQRLGPYLDYAAMANDPLTANLLYSRVMNSGAQSLGLKDVIEIMTMVNTIKGPQQPQQTNISELVAALGSMFKAGVDTAKSGNSDPISAFNAGLQTITPVLQGQTESVRQVFQAQIDSLREELRRKEPTAFLETMQKYSDMFGWNNAGESDQIKLHRLHMEQEERQRAYELERDKWKAAWDEKRESAKTKQQTDVIKNVTGALRSVVESPVAKELGKSVGARIGMKENPIISIQSKAAQDQLANPMAEPWGFKCSKCGTDYTFTPFQLEKLREAGGRWVCPKEGCGAAYKLRDDKQQAT